MFFEGKIKTYHADRGFGFIEIENEADKRDLFFHIKDFPNRKVEPHIGEILKFRILEEFGKRKAVYIVRVDFSETEQDAEGIMHQEYYEHKAKEPRESKGYFAKFVTMIGLIIIAVLAFNIYKQYKAYQSNQQNKIEQLTEAHISTTEKIKESLGYLPDIVPLPQKEERRVKSLQEERQKILDANHAYNCDGRTHCSQMRSYNEAVYFLRNCPGVKMGGNNDGIPCERQFGR